MKSFDKRIEEAEGSNTWTEIIGWALLISFLYFITHP